jgi:DNA (cytosine-5)-methyltransferase 1
VKLRFLSLFSGIEAASVAFAPLGWECVGFSEIEPFPCSVLKHHYPNVQNLGDVNDITDEQIKQLGHIDLVIGGFPCQDVSLAGQRKGLQHEDGTATRSGLFYRAVEIADATKARWVVIENVPGLFSVSEGRAFASVVGGLVGCEIGVPTDGWRNAGFALGPKGLVEWAVLDVQYFGLAQRRKRVFIVRDSGNWRDRPPLLLERESLRRDNPPSREARQDVTGSLSARTNGGGGLGTDFDIGGGLSRPLRAQPNCSHRDDSQTYVPVTSLCLNGGGQRRIDGESETFVAHSLRADGFDASEDGTGRGTPMVPEIVSQAMSAKWAKGSSGPSGDEVANMIPTQNMAVRRLTPTECARLQGFPDDYLDIIHRGKPAADGNKYKALGNSFATTVVAWIGRQIEKAVEGGL